MSYCMMHWDCDFRIFFKAENVIFQQFYIIVLCCANTMMSYAISNERWFYSDHFELLQVKIGVFWTMGEVKMRRNALKNALDGLSRAITLQCATFFVQTFFSVFLTLPSPRKTQQYKIPRGGGGYQWPQDYYYTPLR